MDRSFIWIVAAVVSAAGCGALIGTGWTPAGAGGGGEKPTPASGEGGHGDGPVSASGDGGVPSSTASSVASTTSASSGGCASPATCPGADGACAFRTCTGGVCGTGYAERRTPCAEAGGAVCDGNGACVGCVSDEDCGGMHAKCVAAVCQSCDDGVQNGHESDVDCGGECPKCAPGARCLGDHDCVDHTRCENGVCTEE
jgi:hypothetical protein